jgi:glycosyltransferase involved in cell wall biosynthesis/putative flippase GtrA
MQTIPQPPPTRAPVSRRVVGRTIANPVVDVVVPVLDEARVLGPAVTRLHRYLTVRFPFTFRISIVDNASTDGTWLVATSLARELDFVTALHLDERGRGRALRAAWSTSDAEVVAYTDVDLSTDLDALLPLVAPLVSGHSDVAIGSRLAAGANVARGAKRELVSRGYNAILRTVFATRVRDAQCGFKAVRADVARRLLPAIEDDGWFFDTELLLLAEHNGLRIHEVPVDWVDDPDTRVRIVRTALGDLAGSARMVWTFVTGRGRIELGRTARRPWDDDLGRRLVSFGFIGGVSTAASLLLFLLLHGALGPVRANAVAVTATFVGNTWANARFTARRPRAGWWGAILLYVGALALSSAGLLVAVALGAGRAGQALVLLVTWAAAAAARLALVDAWARLEVAA